MARQDQRAADYAAELIRQDVSFPVAIRRALRRYSGATYKGTQRVLAAMSAEARRKPAPQDPPEAPEMPQEKPEPEPEAEIPVQHEFSFEDATGASGGTSGGASGSMGGAVVAPSAMTSQSLGSFDGSGTDPRRFSKRKKDKKRKTESTRQLIRSILAGRTD